jgi:hypothetical protein
MKKCTYKLRNVGLREVLSRRCQPDEGSGGIAEEAKAWGNAQDMQTSARLEGSGRSQSMFRSESTVARRVRG